MSAGAPRNAGLMRHLSGEGDDIADAHIWQTTEVQRVGWPGETAVLQCARAHTKI